MNWRIPILALLLSTCGCSKENEAVAVRFAAEFGGEAIDCAVSGDRVALSDLRFYISDIAVVRPDGARVSVPLRENGRWQGNGIALLDFENGSGACTNGTADMNTSVAIELEKGAIAALQFTVGVPFGLNHADPLQALAPLNDSSMHWHWRSGYKFMRAGLAGVTDSVYVHLGSAGCRGTVQDIMGCDRPNRFTVSLPGWQPERIVRVDLAALAGATDLHDGVPESCSSGPAEQSCARLFTVFGLAGEGTPSSQQQLFGLAPL